MLKRIIKKDKNKIKIKDDVKNCGANRDFDFIYIYIDNKKLKKKKAIVQCNFHYTSVTSMIDNFIVTIKKIICLISLYFDDFRMYNVILVLPS